MLRTSVTMISILKGNDAEVSGVQSRELCSHYICLGATAGEKYTIHVIGKLICQLLGIQSHLIMQINR